LLGRRGDRARPSRRPERGGRPLGIRRIFPEARRWYDSGDPEPTSFELEEALDPRFEPTVLVLHPQHRGPRPRRRLDSGQHALSGRSREAREGLVEQEELRLSREGEGDPGPATGAAIERMDGALEERAEADPVCPGRRARARELEVRPQGEARGERI
jgi:hypothetical protein